VTGYAAATATPVTQDDLDSVEGDRDGKLQIRLGGIYARDLALRSPEMVRSVITLGSPFANDVRATNATRLYEALSG